MLISRDELERHRIIDQRLSSLRSPVPVPTASIKRRASRTTATARSARLTARSRAMSKTMLNWRRTVARHTEADGIFMSILLDDFRIVRSASPESTAGQLTLKVDERFHRDPRCAEFHDGAGNRI